MSCIIVENQSVATIAVGTLIVIDATRARAYDSMTDDIEDVIGVAYAVSKTSGRAWRIPDGPEFYLNDQIVWQENLQYQEDENGNPVINEEFAGFNPYADTDHFTCTVYNGVVPVLSSYSSVPSRWKLLHEGTTHDWYLAR